MENAFKMEFFNSAKFFNNAKNQLEFTKETRFARYQSKFSLIFGIKKKFCFVEKIFHFLSVVHTTNTHLLIWITFSAPRSSRKMETSHQKSGQGFTIIIFGFSKETHFTSTHSQTREIGHNIDALIVAITQRQ